MHRSDLDPQNITESNKQTISLRKKYFESIYQIAIDDSINDEERKLKLANYLKQSFYQLYLEITNSYY